MKKSIITLSVAAAMGGFAGSASAQAVDHLIFNPTGVGHILLVPYFSTQSANVTAINNRGQIVGCRGWESVFVWANGRTSLLPVPKGSVGRCASDINDRGQAVGWSEEAIGDDWAWLWTNTG